MRVAGVLMLVLAASLLALYLWGNSQYTACYAAFSVRDEAERAAATARALGFGADVEESGPEDTRPDSFGGRQIGVTFSDGETGPDAETFVRAFGGLVERGDGTLGHPGNGCMERHTLGE